MCDVTTAIIGAIAGSLWQGHNAQRQARAQARAEESNALIADRNAQQMEEKAEQNAQNVAREAEQRRRVMLAKANSQVASVGASGIQSNTGSALNVLSQNFANIDYETGTQLYNGRQQTDQYLNQQTEYNNQAGIHRQNASNYRKAGRNAMLGGIVNAITGGMSLAASNYSAKSAANYGGSKASTANQYTFEKSHILDWGGRSNRR